MEPLPPGAAAGAGGTPQLARKADSATVFAATELVGIPDAATSLHQGMYRTYIKTHTERLPSLLAPIPRHSVMPHVLCRLKRRPNPADNRSSCERMSQGQRERAGGSKCGMVYILCPALELAVPPAVLPPF